MANSTRNKRGGKTAAAPAPVPAPPAAAPAATPAAKTRSPWTIVGIVIGALIVLALVFGGGVAAGFGLAGGVSGLARLRAASAPYAFGGEGWMMPGGEGMPFGPYFQYRMPYGEQGEIPFHMAPFGDEGELPYGMMPRAAGTAYLGITFEPVAAEQAEQAGLAAGEGALVSTVIDGGPAAAAGLQPGDILLEVDGERIVRTALLRRLIQAHAPDDVVALLLLRDGKEQTLEVTLGQVSVPQTQ